MHTLRASDEEASHAEASNQSLGQPDQAIAALTITTIANGDTEQELSEDYKHRASDDEWTPPLIPSHLHPFFRFVVRFEQPFIMVSFNECAIATYRMLVLTNGRLLSLSDLRSDRNSSLL